MSSRSPPRLTGLILDRGKRFIFIPGSILSASPGRNITGTLALVGTGKWHPDNMKTTLEAVDRSAAGPTAPAHGLYLIGVDYPAI